MDKNSLSPKIITILAIKILLLICLWKLFFNQPLTKEQRKTGITSQFISLSYGIKV